MNTPIQSPHHLKKIGEYLFNFGLLAGLTTITFGLISCGGGGGGDGTGNSATSSTAATISRMTTIAAASSPQARGTIASSSPQALNIIGTNFGSGVAGVTVSITTPGPGAGTVDYPASSVTPTRIIANITIPSVPTDRYVTVTVQPATGSSVSGILGVAQNYRTIATNIQAIFNSNCGGCHVGNLLQQGGLDLRDTKSANTLNEVAPTTCTPSAQFRVTPGDPRRANNALIDVIKAKNSSTYVFCQMPRGAVSAVSATDIDTIIDWISLGAI